MHERFDHETSTASEVELERSEQQSLPLRQPALPSGASAGRPNPQLTKWICLPK